MHTTACDGFKNNHELMEKVESFVSISCLLCFKINFLQTVLTKKGLSSWAHTTACDGFKNHHKLMEKVVSFVTISCLLYIKINFLAVLRIHDILLWIRIRIRGSMPLTNGSGSGSDPSIFTIDLQDAN
jgi:hypothetical protein